MSKNLHKGHRSRVRKRYLNSGMDSFEDHEVLELLLFYCYPMKDTNEIAHKMIKEFGSLINLFEAHPLEIISKCNVTENVAVLVSLIPSLTKRYSSAKWDKKVSLDTSSKAGSFISSLFVGKSNECFYIICLDVHKRFIYAPLISEGTIDQTTIYPRKIVESCIRYQAAYVFLAHNHPSGQVEASRDDIESTKKIVNALEPIGIIVLDHIIISGDKYFSFVEKKLLKHFALQN